MADDMAIPTKTPQIFICEALWSLADSNRGHTDFQSDALPTELRNQFQCICFLERHKDTALFEKSKLF